MAALLISIVLLLAIIVVEPGHSYVFGSNMISHEEFNRAVHRAGYLVPKDETYRNFVEATHGSFTRDEAAMLLAQMLYESGGFMIKEDLGCLRGDHCLRKYSLDQSGLPGKNYHGRGYLKVAWGANYRAASDALGYGETLLSEPDLVTTDPRLAMLVSVWYWEQKVRPKIVQPKSSNDGDHNDLQASRRYRFGDTTRALNPYECVRNPERAHRRWMTYIRVAESLHVSNFAEENGCYN
ncbi:hypothetical protein TKK_0007499 [Trichogramma kaykai]